MCVASECDAKDLAVILTKSKLIIALKLNLNMRINNWNYSIYIEYMEVKKFLNMTQLKLPFSNNDITEEVLNCHEPKAFDGRAYFAM